MVDAQQLAVSGGSAEQTAEYIPSAFIGGHDAVANHKSSAADMVGYHTNGNIIFLVCTVGFASN